MKALSGVTSIVGLDAGGIGDSTYCAVFSGGSVDCWGNQSLGNGTDGNSDVPVPVTGLTGATSLAGVSQTSRSVR